MRWRLWLPTVLGTLIVGAALLVGVVGPPSSGEEVPLLLAGTLGLAMVILSLSKLYRDPTDGGGEVAPPPWSEEGTLVDSRPESTPETDRISGTDLAASLEATAESVKTAETLEEGVESVREPLRRTLVSLLRQSGRDDAEIQGALETGRWTSDRTAAAILDDAVDPPERSLRRRVWAWLFPEKALRHRTALTVGAIARVADAELPPVVGQHAPRPVPVLEPTLDDLQRAADGELRRAVEGRAAVGAPAVDANRASARGPDTESGDDAGEADSQATSDNQSVDDSQTSGDQGSAFDGESSDHWTAEGDD